MTGGALRNGFVSAAVTGVVILLPLGMPASASGSGWTVVPSPNATKLPGSQLSGVSCTSAGCVAVGWSGSVPSATLVETLAVGGKWKVMSSPSPGPKGSTLQGVSCPTTSECVAVGTRSTSTSHAPLIETETGGIWKVTPSPAPESGSLVGVSCTTATSCVAVGNYSTSSAEVSLIETLAAGTWKVTTSPNPVGSLATRLEGVSCARVTSCVAVGIYGPPAAFNATLIETLAHGAWKITKSPSPSTLDSDLFAVSCQEGMSCVATGYYAPSSGGIFTLIETRVRGVWKVTKSPTPADSNNPVLTGVSCNSSSACVAVGGTGLGTLVETFSGGTWTVTKSANPTGSTTVALSGSSCLPAPAACNAVGYFNTGSNNKTLVETGPS